MEGKGPSVNEVLVELPEGEPGDLTCRQMMAGIVPSDSSVSKVLWIQSPVPLPL